MAATPNKEASERLKIPTYDSLMSKSNAKKSDNELCKKLILENTKLENQVSETSSETSKVITVNEKGEVLSIKKETGEEMDDECASHEGASHIAGKKRKMFKCTSMKYDEDKKEYILHTHPEIHRWGVPNPICPGSFLPDWQAAQHNIDITPENIIEDEYYNLRNTGPKFNPEGKIRCFSDKKVDE